MAQTNLLAGSANRDAGLAMQLRMARIAHEQNQRNTMMSILQKIAQDRQAKKAAAAKSGGWGALGGAGIGALVAAPFTAGLSLAAAAPMLAAGAGLGATVGGAVDQTQGKPASNLGSGLMDFSTGMQRNQALYGESVPFGAYAFDPEPYATPYPSAGMLP
jgi:hypothetical protein